MPKYLIQASYTAEGTKGLLKEGGSQRRVAAQEAVKGVGGVLDAFYYAFGEIDVVAIADVPDNVSAAALSLAVSASGALNTRMTVLLTPEEIDQAARKTVGYRPPGR